MAMRRNPLLLVALTLVLTLCAVGAAAANGLLVPGSGITGNDTGGILPYTPDVATTYKQIASDYCARWGRLYHITSVHPVYGDYIAWVCMDKPGMIH
jgi:hypothetical protein